MSYYGVPGSSVYYEDSERFAPSVPGNSGPSNPPLVVSEQSSTVSELIRELQEQGRDHGSPIPTPRTVGAATPRSTTGGANQRLSELLATAGVDVRDGEMVACDIGAGSGFVEFFEQTLRMEDQTLRDLESGAVTSAARAARDSLYSTVQIEAAGLQEDNDALTEKVAELQQSNDSLRARVQQSEERNLEIERESARLQEANRELERLNDALLGQMHRESEDLKAEIALLQATAKAQKQEMELARTRLEQELRLESVQQYQARVGDHEDRVAADRVAEEGRAYKRNYDVVYAQAHMLQERVWSLEKDLLECQQHLASEDALLENAFFKEEVARITRELMEVKADCETQKLTMQADCEAQKSKLMERLNEARGLLEKESEKNKELENFKEKCAIRISGIETAKLCSLRDFSLAQQLLLDERVQNTRGKYLAIWTARYRRKKGMDRTRMWMASRLQRRQKLHVLHFIRQRTQRRKRLDQSLFTFEWRKSRRLRRVVILQWARVARTTRALRAAANAFLEQSGRALVQDSLLQWQKLVVQGKMAAEHVKSSEVRRSFRAATAAMSSLDVQDFQDFLPTMAPDVYGGSIKIVHETPQNVFDVIVRANARRHVRGLRLSVLSEWHRAAVACKRLKQCYLKIMLRLDKSLLKNMFAEWRTSWVASSNVDRISASRAEVIKQAAQDILPPWMHLHIDRALTDSVPEEQRTSKSKNTVSVQTSKSQNPVSVQVELKQVGEDIPPLLDKYSRLLSYFVQRKTLNVPFFAWRLYLSKKRKQKETCRRAHVARTYRTLQNVLFFWLEQVSEVENSIVKPMELWLSKLFRRDTYAWAFSVWISHCKQTMQGQRRARFRSEALETPGRDEVAGEEMYDVPITLSPIPQRMGAPPPRVMGMSPPLATYESPRTRTDVSLSGRDQHESTANMFGEEDIMIELVLSMRMEQLAGIEEDFKALLIIDIAQATFGKPDRIKIHNIQAGSVIVTFALQEGVCDDGRSLRAVASDLEYQARDSQSKLKQGRYTSQATSVKILTQISIAESVSAVQDIFGRILCPEPMAPRRARSIMLCWSKGATRQRMNRRRVELLLRRSKRDNAGKLDMCFKLWWQRKFNVAALTDGALKMRNCVVLQHFIAAWWKFLQQNWQLRKTATILNHREARGIMQKWKAHTDKQRGMARILAVLRMTATFEKKLLGHVFGAWRKRVLTKTHGRIREVTLLRSSFRSWFCNAHVAVLLWNGFQDQVLAMSTFFVSDIRTHRLQNEFSCLKGRRRALKACGVFAKEMGLTIVQKNQRDAFESWRAFCEWRSSGREFNDKVESLSDSRMVQKYLFAWARGIEKRKRNTDVIFRIIKRWNRALRWQILSTWNIFTRMRSEVSHKISSFCGRANRRVKQKVLTDWKTLSEFEEMLSHIAEVMDVKLLRRVCFAWHQRLVEVNMRLKKVWRAELLIRRNTVRILISKWHSQAVKQVSRNKAVDQMLHSVLKGKLWVATMSWRNHTRMVASGKSKAAWLYTKYIGSVMHRALWTWSQFCRNSKDAEYILVRAQGRRMTQTAEETLERTTLLEWLYRQQFKALYRVRLQRAAVLVQRRRLRAVVRAWHNLTEKKIQNGEIVFALDSKRDSVLLVAHFRMWIDVKFKKGVWREREDSFAHRLWMRKIRKCISAWKLETRKTSRNPTSSRMQTRLADKNILVELKRVIWMRWTFAMQSRRIEAANVRRAAILVYKIRARALLNRWREKAQTIISSRNTLRHILNKSRNSALYRSAVAWTEFVQQKRVDRRNAERGANLWHRRLLREKVSFWRESARVVKNNKHILRTFKNRVQHATFFSIYCKWARYVAGTSQIVIKNETTLWIRLAGIKLMRNENLLYKALHTWENRRKAKRGANLWFRRVLREKVMFWRESARVIKNSKHILRTLKNRLQHATILSVYCKWARHVEGASQVKHKTLLWIEIAAKHISHNDNVLIKALQIWKDCNESLKAFLDKTSFGAVLRMKYAALKTGFQVWVELVCDRRQNRSTILRFEHGRLRNLQRSMFSTWLLLMEEVTALEFDASRWDDWRGPVPEWYAESLIAVIQQRMTTTARILRAWSKLVDQYYVTIARFRERLCERWSRCLFTRWHQLKDYTRMIKMDYLTKEECISRRAELHLQRDAVRVWVAYTRKYSALRMGNMCVDCCFLARRKLAFGRAHTYTHTHTHTHMQYPKPMQKSLPPRQISFLRRCGELVWIRDANTLNEIFAGWRLRNSEKNRRLRICQSLLQSGQYGLVRRIFTGFKSYCSREVYHSHHLNRLKDVFSASLHRRFTHSQLATWHCAAELRESRTDRLMLTLKILSRKARQEQVTRVFASFIAYRDQRHRLRASEHHVLIRTQIWYKRRVFGYWKDLERLKYLSQILEKWYKLSIGQLLQVMQRKALLSISEMYDRTTTSIVADMQKTMTDDATDPFAKENRAVQFQDPLHQTLLEPSSMTQTQDVTTSRSDRGRSESPRQKGSQEKSTAAPQNKNNKVNPSETKKSVKQGGKEKLNLIALPRQTAASLLRTGASRATVTGAPSAARGRGAQLQHRAP